MTYQVSRNGQMYGPYTLEDLQRYVASGNVLLTDMAKSDTMPDWIPSVKFSDRLASRRHRPTRLLLRIRRRAGSTLIHPI